MSRGRRTLTDILAAPRRIALAPGEGPPDGDPPAPSVVRYPGVDPRLAALCGLLIRGELEHARSLCQDIARDRGEEAHAQALRDLARPETLEPARRIARAFAWLGRSAPSELMARAPSLGQEDLDALTAVRRAGDEAAQAVAARERASGRSYPVTNSADDFFALARAVIATPSRFSLGAPPPPGAGREVKLRVSGDCLLELWRRPPAGERRTVTLLHQATRAAGTGSLWLAVRHEAIADGAPLRITAQLRIGDTRATDAAGRIRSVTNHVRRRHPDLRPMLAEMADEARQSFSAAVSSLAKELESAPDLTLGQLVGEPSCTHTSGRWRPNSWGVGAESAADAVSYDCPDCHRAQIAVVALHRLRADHPQARHLGDPEAQQRYLARERFHRELAGDSRPVRSLAALRAADPPLGCEDGVPQPQGPAAAGRSSSLGRALTG